jgi:hypothetical protein
MQQIFLSAVEQHRPEDWEAYLDQACAGDDELRNQVKLLLKAHGEAGSVPGAAAQVQPQTSAHPAAVETAGTTIGAYKLIEPIGEGGMGAVWMAQQTEPVKRLVALKLIKAGMDSKRVLARFEAERQALALMDHPNIARVLDAGTAPTGRPYFVMDLVKGVSMTRYCDEHRLTPRQRLQLFIPVCQAVQHAHQKGIIHRDLKPSNVLVALYDGKPVPKVIDFGVAKASGQSLTEKTLVTGFGDIVGTLEYMHFRLFNVALGASLTLDHVTLEGGSVFGSEFGQPADGFGGAVYNQGTLMVSDSTLSFNTTKGNNPDLSKGGGIYNAGGTVTLTNSSVWGNVADGGYGGGIYNAGGWVTVDNSTLWNNSATVEDYGGVSDDGPGIYNDAQGTVTVQNSSSITGNLWLFYGEEFSLDVDNLGVLNLDSTSTIGYLVGNPAIPFDPNAPELQIHDVTVTEGNTGAVAAQFNVTLSAASTETITVAYATANGTAIAGSDFQAASDTLTFAPGETSKTVSVLVNGDRLGEPNETFSVNLSAAANAIITVGHGIGTIVDDEPRISISDVAKAEGKKGQTTLFTFTVTLSAAYDQPVTMSYRTMDGTAKSGEDFAARTGTLTFAPGETTKAITIEVKGDSKKEANETFYLDLFGNSSNSLFAKYRGIGTILNDD